MNTTYKVIILFLLFSSIKLSAQTDTTNSQKKPVLLVIECNKALYLNYLHENWKEQLHLENTEIKNMVYADILNVTIDSLEKRFDVSKADDYTYSSYSFDEEIKRNAHYYMDNAKAYKTHKDDRKNNYKESKLSENKPKKKKNKPLDPDRKLVRNDIDKFLNIRFHNNDFFDELKKQGFDYVLFITEVFIENDRSGKYDYNQIIKVDYSFYSKKGTYIYGNREIQTIKKKNIAYKNYKKNILPMVGGNIANNIKMY